MLAQLFKRSVQGRHRGVADVAKQVFLFHDSQVFQRDGGADRVPGIRIAMVEFTCVHHGCDLVRNDGAADGGVARAEPLGDGHDVGADPDGLRAKPVPGPAEPADHLVRDEQDIVFSADTLDFRPIGAGRDNNAASALDRFTDEGRDLLRPEFEDFFLKLLRAGKAECLRGLVAAF